MKSAAQETFLCGRFFLKALCYFSIYVGKQRRGRKKTTLCAAPSNYLIEKMQKKTDKLTMFNQEKKRRAVAFSYICKETCLLVC